MISHALLHLVVASFDGWVLKAMVVMLYVMNSHSSAVLNFWYTRLIRGQFQFENQLNRSGCAVHGYDPTVSSRPDMRFHFHRLGLSNKSAILPKLGQVATLSQIVHANGHEAHQLTLLKCDIEGSEWDALDQMMSDAATLASLRHIVIELHLGCYKCPNHIQKVGSLGHAEWLRFFQTRISRLLELFDLYYAYPNTCDCASGRSIDGVIIPSVWELSLARKGLLLPFSPLAPSHTNGYGEKRCRWSQSCDCTCQTSDAATCMCTTHHRSHTQQQNNTHTFGGGLAARQQQQATARVKSNSNVGNFLLSPLASPADLTDNSSSSALKCNGSSAPVYGRALPLGTSAYQGGRKIPQYLHLSMKSRCLHELWHGWDSNPRGHIRSNLSRTYSLRRFETILPTTQVFMVSADWVRIPPVGRHAKTVHMWKDALPSYAVFFHDDAAVERLLEQDWPEFPGLREALHCAVYSGAMRIDIWRLLIVYRYGGMYTDIDIWPTAAFREATIKHDDQAFFLRDAWKRPSQWLFAMEPRHPIAYFTMQEVITRVLMLKNVHSPRVVFTTGPDALKHGFLKAMMNRSLSARDKGLGAQAQGPRPQGPTRTKFGESGKEYLAQQSSGAHKVTARLMPTGRSGTLVQSGLGTVKLAWNVTVSGVKKVQMDSGNLHWSTLVYRTSKGKQRMSCKALLNASRLPWLLELRTENKLLF